MVLRSPLRTRDSGNGDRRSGGNRRPTARGGRRCREVPVAIIGGGWLSCLGFTPGVSAACFYDSLLRWQPTSGWTFETLGLAGRDGDVSVELHAWRRLLH